MNYAVISDGVVANVIWLSPANAQEFPGAVPIDDRPVGIGDSYADGKFCRDGAEVLTIAEQLAAARAEITALDAALLDAAYESIIGGMEI